MSSTLSELSHSLQQLSHQELHQSNRQASRRAFGCEWELAGHLLATERSGLYRHMGSGSVVGYAVTHLNLHPQKAGELLSLARVFEQLPLLSAAFREGKLCWSKARALKRIATPDNQAEMLEFALKNKAQAVERAVALTPTQHKRGQALKASLEARQIQPERSFSEQPTTPAAPVVQSAPTRKPAPTPEMPKLRQVTLLLTAEQYAILEQAKGLVEARQGKRVSKETAVTAMAATFLATADSRSKVRHQVIVHVNGQTGQGFYDTDRGLLPAEPAAVDEAMKQPGIVVVAAPTVLPAGSQAPLPAEASQAEQLPLLPNQSKARPGLPVGLVRAVYARAFGRCERCSCGGGNLVVHHVRAWSESRRHRLEDLQLLCPGCHAAEHDKDFATKPAWKAAREAAVRSRTRPGTRSEAELIPKRTGDEIQHGAASERLQRVGLGRPGKT
ncbi:MAG: HNH endonuclease signature motif containing protein [Vulcanimicrobiota bacterium]